MDGVDAGCYLTMGIGQTCLRLGASENRQVPLMKDNFQARSSTFLKIHPIYSFPALSMSRLRYSVCPESSSQTNHKIRINGQHRSRSGAETREYSAQDISANSNRTVADVRLNPSLGTVLGWHLSEPDGA
jgi:hypothetical protein